MKKIRKKRLPDIWEEKVSKYGSTYQADDICNLLINISKGRYQYEVAEILNVSPKNLYHWFKELNLSIKQHGGNRHDKQKLVGNISF